MVGVQPGAGAGVEDGGEDVGLGAAVPAEDLFHDEGRAGGVVVGGGAGPVVVNALVGDDEGGLVDCVVAGDADDVPAEGQRRDQGGLGVGVEVGRLDVAVVVGVEPVAVAGV